ncbi:MAG: hydrogenase formation protein HypD [SAR324 cluster bacterium]|nr:hydrogenase formation protein HypD [SAR324 cluster bacterium]
MTMDPQLYKSKELVSGLADQIRQVSSGMSTVKIMHVCGTHEHEIVRYGIRQLLPANVHIVAGPGCPVCICPVEDIDRAITLSHAPDTTVLTFGDMIRVPATKTSLEAARRDGGSVKMVYSPFDAVTMARENPAQTFVFFSVGFETTAAGVAALIQRGVPENLYFLIANRYLPPVMKLLMEVHDDSLQGFLLPGHAATITGIHAYDFMIPEFNLPCTVTGFEPVDLLAGILELLLLIRNKDAKIINAFPRAVQEYGNTRALAILDKVFVRKPGIWRGIDIVDDTAYTLRPEYDHVDARKHLDGNPPYPPRARHPACQCHRVILGEIIPTECKLFGNVCTPNSPYGPCMVSVDGTCQTWFTYGSQEDNDFER